MEFAFNNGGGDSNDDEVVMKTNIANHIKLSANDAYNELMMTEIMMTISVTYFPAYPRLLNSVHADPEKHTKRNFNKYQ